MALKNKLASLAGGAAFALTAMVSLNANAAVFTIVPGAADALAADFNPVTTAATAAQMLADGVGAGTAITVFGSTATNLQGLFVSPNPVNLSFTFMGFEAAFTNGASNSLLYSGATIFTNTAAEVGNIFATALYNVGSDPGLTPISFQTDGEGGGIATNGAGTTGERQIAFFIVAGQPNVAYAFFDDGGGTAPRDGDFDDMIIRIVATNPEIGEVPLPGAVFLFGSVLAAGVGGLHLRRRRVAKG